MFIKQEANNLDTMYDRVRTANLPQFQLSPKEAVLIVGLASVFSYVFGFVVGALI